MFMITKKTLFIFTVLLSLILSGCILDPPARQRYLEEQSKIKTPDGAQVNSKDRGWATYDTQEGWSLKYPSEWPVGDPETQDNFFISLYVGDPDVEIFATTKYKSIKDIPDIRFADHSSLLTTDQGAKGRFFYGELSWSKIYVFVLKTNQKMYTIYAQAPNAFFDKYNNKLFYLMAKSLKVTS